ncbi:hypothetical protein [Leptothoe kymatousa]|nr:hypothetical protein [Leptothoe kymatousa]
MTSILPLRFERIHQYLLLAVSRPVWDALKGRRNTAILLTIL